jgi:hypothetical protein
MASDTAKYQQVILGNYLSLDLIQIQGRTQTAGWYQAVRMPTSPHKHHIHLALDVFFLFSFILSLI